MTYTKAIQEEATKAREVLLGKKVDERFCIFSPEPAAVPPRMWAPSQAMSKFQMEQALGDWAESQVAAAINRSKDYKALAFGDDDKTLSQDETFADLYREGKIRELKFGKRSDLLLFKAGADVPLKATALSGEDAEALVENQIEKTDHRHLGQILTYAAGLEAKTMVWIASKFTEEHRAALDWLNENTKDDISFFGVEIEVWRISGSAPAPKFSIISKPNDWSRTVKDVAEGNVSSHKLAQQRFWRAFADYVSNSDSIIRCTKPLPQHWMSISLGRSGFKLSAVISAWNSETNTWGAEVRAEVVLTRETSKSDFAALINRKEELESKFGGPLTWHNPEGKTMCRIYVRKDTDFLNETLWPEQFAWLKVKLEALHRAFAPAIKSL